MMQNQTSSTTRNSDSIDIRIKKEAKNMNQFIWNYNLQKNMATTTSFTTKEDQNFHQKNECQ